MSPPNPLDPRPSSTTPVDWSTEPQPSYATGVHIAPTLREFNVIFDDAAPFPGRNAPAGDANAVRSRIVSSLRIAPDAYFRMVCALATSWNRFAQNALPPAGGRPRFKLIESGEMQLDGVDG